MKSHQAEISAKDSQQCDVQSRILVLETANNSLQIECDRKQNQVIDTMYMIPNYKNKISLQLFDSKNAIQLMHEMSNIKILEASLDQEIVLRKNSEVL